MLNRLLGIKSLEDTEPVELEELDVEVPTEAQLPSDFILHLDHSYDFSNDPSTVLDLNQDESEEEAELEVDDGNA